MMALRKHPGTIAGLSMEHPETKSSIRQSNDKPEFIRFQNPMKILASGFSMKILTQRLS